MHRYNQIQRPASQTTTISTPSTSRASQAPSTSYEYATTTTTRPRTERQSHGRAGKSRARTAVSTIGIESQHIICAVSESRGISPTVGLAFVNLDTGEAVLSQICDSQTYVRTIHKLAVFSPSEILITDTASNPKSKLYSIIEENLLDLNSNIMLLDRRYWAETTGLEYIQQFAFLQDVESLKMSISGNYFSVCCFAAVIKYIELSLAKTFPIHSLRIKYEASEGSMMIDLSTIRSLELNQNLQNPKSKDCLFGLLNETLTPMGSRLLRSNILQPLTDSETIENRYAALEELTTKEQMFFGTRAALRPFLDVDKTLTALIIIPTQASLQYTEQSINNVIMLKQFLGSVKPVFEALAGASSPILQQIQRLCNPEHLKAVQELIDTIINEDITYATKPIDLRNQRTFAINSGVNGLLDVARQTYKESSEDIYHLIDGLSEEHGIPLQIMYDNRRQFYIRFAAVELEDRLLSPVFINVFKKKKNIECQTLEVMKINQKVVDSHTEVLLMSDKAIQTLIFEIRQHVSVLFKISESIAMLDMLASFAQLVTVQDYVRPHITTTLGIRAARHPIREKVQSNKFIPNDVYATQQSRFQVITGCNMSGKSTYIRSIALMCVMAQIGCFVPAQFASFTIVKWLFARVSIDDSIEANVSTFASEMRETAFILHNVDRDSLVIIDELGRGTSTRDGLAIALAIAEALVHSRALVWFATHFRELAHIMSERNGVVNKHLAVDMSGTDNMTMLYKITDGVVAEEHYGLALAKVLPFSADVLEDATFVAGKLREQTERRRKASISVVHARKRRLVLALKEQLLQSHQGAMEGDVLKSWLRELQREFVVQMVAIDNDAREAAALDDSEMGDDIVGAAERESSMLTLNREGSDIERNTRENTMLTTSGSDLESVVEILESVERR